jgi:hypothetical protein
LNEHGVRKFDARDGESPSSCWNCQATRTAAKVDQPAWGRKSLENQAGVGREQRMTVKVTLLGFRKPIAARIGPQRGVHPLR